MVGKDLWVQARIAAIVDTEPTRDIEILRARFLKKGEHNLAVHAPDIEARHQAQIDHKSQLRCDEYGQKICLSRLFKIDEYEERRVLAGKERPLPCRRREVLGADRRRLGFR